MAKRSFPLDNAFDDLRRVVEASTAAITSWTKAIGGASGGGSSAGASGGGLVGDASSAVADLAKIEAAFSRIKATKQGLQAGGTVAQALGLEAASLELEKMAKRVEVIGNLGTGIVSSMRALRVAFLPVVGAAGLLVAGMVGVQQILQRTTGTAITLRETFVLLGLRFKQTFQEAKVVYFEFTEAVSGRTRETVDNIANARRELSGVQGEIAKMADEIAGRPAPTAAADLTLSGVFAESKAQLGELATASAEVIDGAFASLDKAIDQKTAKGRATRFSPTGLKTEFQTFMADMQQIGDVTANTFQFIQSGVQQLSATISSSLLDAFLDPQADIRQSFGQLFRALAQQLMQLLIQALIVKAVSGIAGGLTGPETISYAGATSGGVTRFGMADGGEVPNRTGRPSLAHLFARGFARGGRPAGVPASDTVAAWLTPGEWVQPLASVRKYGEGFMESVRTGRFPEALAHAFSGIGAPARVGSTMPRGYAAGGMVTGGGAGGGGASPVPVGVIANEQTMDRLIAGGSGAMMRWARENRAALKNVLG